MKYAYFPGCCYHTSAKEYEVSTRSVSKKAGLELVEIPDWNCCGSTAAHGKSRLLSLALPARSLAKAEEMGLDVTASCAACFQRLAVASKKLSADPVLLEKVGKIIERPFEARVKVKSSVEVFNSFDPEQLRDKIVSPLAGLKVAAYYGCFLVRPPEVVGYDDPENPQAIDRLMQLIGAGTVDWPHKTECCGASHSITNEEIVFNLVGRILKAAQDSGANCVVTACPLCHFNLDLRQQRLNNKFGTSFNLPVFYFTQLVGLAMGLDYKELSLYSHYIDPFKLLKSAG